jgi:hypothetical protein
LGGFWNTAYTVGYWVGYQIGGSERKIKTPQKVEDINVTQETDQALKAINNHYSALIREAVGEDRIHQNAGTQQNNMDYGYNEAKQEIRENFRKGGVEI